MKRFYKARSQSSFKFCFFKGPNGPGEGGGGDWLPEGPKDFKTLAIDTIRESQRSAFSDPNCDGFKFLEAAYRFVIRLPETPDATDAIPLAFFINAQLSLVQISIDNFLDHINPEIEVNATLGDLREIKLRQKDSISAQKKYYDRIFEMWCSHQIFYEALQSIVDEKGL